MPKRANKGVFINKEYNNLKFNVYKKKLEFDELIKIIKNTFDVLCVIETMKKRNLKHIYECIHDSINKAIDTRDIIALKQVQLELLDAIIGLKTLINYIKYTLNGTHKNHSRFNFV